jgi:hypothetical protein
MKRWPYPLIFGAAVALAVLAPSAVSAKVMPVAATVCGADRCVEVGQGPGSVPFELMMPAIDPPRASAPPARTGRWYSVDLTFGPPAVRAEARSFRNQFPVAFLPGPGYLRTGVSYTRTPRGGGRRGAAVDPGFRWVELTSAEIAAYVNTVRGVEPFPAAALRTLEDQIPSGSPTGADRQSRAAAVPDPDGSGAGWSGLVVGAGALLALGAAGAAWALRGRSARRARHAR